MSLIKDIYIRELEAEWSKLEDAGIPTDLAYQMAGKRAYDNIREAMARRADLERMLRKEH